MIAILAAAKAFWRFLGTPVGVWVLRISVCLGLLVCGELHGFYRGVQHEKDAETARVEAAKKVVKKVEAKAMAITTKTDEHVAKREVEIRIVTKTLVERIPVYVDAQADSVAFLPLGLLRLHNQAVAGVSEVPGDPNFVSEAPSGVAASTFGRVLVENYGTAREWKEAALACRSWAIEQAANFNSNIDTARP